MNAPYSRGVRGHGFSLIEILVSVFLGSICMLAVYKVFALSESYRRTSMGGAVGQQNGLLALYSIEKDIRQSGYGFNSGAAAGCTLRVHNANLPTPSYAGLTSPDYTMTLAPVLITKGVGGLPDIIAVTYGNKNISPSGAQLIANGPSSNSFYTINSRAGYSVLDYFIVAESGNCSMGQVTGLPTMVGRTLDIDNDPSTFNPDLSGRTNFTTIAKVFNMGAAPKNLIYAISKNNLTVVNTFAPTPSASVMTFGIVGLKAWYGMKTGSTVNYTSTTPATSAEWSNLVSVRVAVASINWQMNRKDRSGVCNTTTTPPGWSFNSSSDVEKSGIFDLANVSDWQCYRYRVFQTIVPIRNMVWQQ
jgi:type IV pilus assembly protein PilW